MDVVTSMEQGGLSNAIHVSAAFADALTGAGLPEGMLLVPSAGSFFLERMQRSPPGLGATPGLGLTPGLLNTPSATPVIGTGGVVAL